jgi:hypothetical protein
MSTGGCSCVVDAQAAPWRPWALVVWVVLAGCGSNAADGSGSAGPSSSGTGATRTALARGAAIRAQLQAAPRLRGEKVSLVLKRLASRAGLADPDRYSSHSTRRGFAAELRRHGASDLEIAAAGGWQRLDQVRRYATSAAIWHDPPAARLGL